MSLFDRDKSSGDRSNPSIDSHDNLVTGALMARGATSTNYTTVNPNTDANKAIQLGLGRLVKVTFADVINAGIPQTINSFPHGLPYIPAVMGSLNGVTIGPSTNANLPLPTFVNASIGGVTTGVVTFGSYVFCYTDETYVYTHLLNATGNPLEVVVTLYLYQQRAAIN